MMVAAQVEGMVSTEDRVLVHFLLRLMMAQVSGADPALLSAGMAREAPLVHLRQAMWNISFLKPCLSSGPWLTSKH